MRDINLIILELKNRLKDSKPLNAVVKYYLDGTTSVILDGTGGSNEVCDGDKKADVTLTMSSDTLAMMLNGEISGFNAFLKGKVKLSGNPAVAKRLGDILDAR